MKQRVSVDNLTTSSQFCRHTNYALTSYGMRGKVLQKNQYTSWVSNSAKSTDPDSMGGIRYAARSSEANAATIGILFKFFTKGMSSLSPTAISFWLISTMRSSFLLNSGFSTSSTAGKILAVVRFVCVNRKYTTEPWHKSCHVQLARGVKAVL